LLVVATVLGLLLVYAFPVAAVIAGLVARSAPLGAIGAASWLLMALTYLPTLRFYRLSVLRSLMLPFIALLYAAMTVDSAWQHARGRGGSWKGRTAVPPASRRAAPIRRR
jgi:hypothetical protein